MGLRSSEPLLKGSPLETPITPNSENLGKTPENTPNPKPTDEVIYKGLTGEFKSVNDLTDYTRRLEAQLAAERLDKERKEVEKNSPIGGLYKGQEKEISKEEAERMFQDPVGFANKLTQNMRQELDLRDRRKGELDKFWNDFYEENPSLKPHKNVVDLTMKDKWAELEQAPLNRAKEILARETTRLITSIRGQEGRKETLPPANESITLESSKGQGPLGMAPETNSETTFLDELKNLRDKRRNKR
jgi:hypothetical protein